MNRILTIAGVLGVGVVLFGFAKAKQQRAAITLSVLEGQRLEAQVALKTANCEHARMLQQRSVHGLVPVSSSSATQFSPALADWLAVGSFEDAPPTLIPELRKALGLADNFLSDYVFVSKASMQGLRPPSPGHNNKLADALCALLS